MNFCKRYPEICSKINLKQLLKSLIIIELLIIKYIGYKPKIKVSTEFIKLSAEGLRLDKSVETILRCITDFYHVYTRNTVTKQIFVHSNSIYNFSNLVWISMTPD